MSSHAETAELIIEPGGLVRMIYSELIKPHAFGVPTIERASLVEPDQHGQWWADLTPSNGPRLGPYVVRSLAIQAEVSWLREYWLDPIGS